MTKIANASLSIFTVLALSLGLVGSASAQGKKDEAFGTGVSSQCAHVSDPQLKDDCVRKLREAQLGSERSWQGGSSASSSSQGVGSFGIGSGAASGVGAPGKSRR
jgi:hypothetical protein